MPAASHPSAPAGPARPPVRLVRAAPAPAPVRLDPVQQQVVTRPAGSGPLVLLGAPGTGKTTTVVETVVHRIHQGHRPQSILVLAPTRLASAALRDTITARLARTLVEPIARTPAAYAFALIRRESLARGGAPPRLISGPEQDAILADLLAGHAAGDGDLPDWPTPMREALHLSGFRHELRDLFMRAMERGIGPQELAELGREHDRPHWVAAATMLREYMFVTALAAPGAYDPAAILDQAVVTLQAQPEVLAAERARWSLVVAEDAHEGGSALRRLLQAIRPPGTDLLLTGDPDATTQGYRGADPYFLTQAGELFTRADGAPAQRVVLATRWRTPPHLVPVVRGVAAGIGTAAAGRQRLAAAAPVPAEDDGSVRPGAAAPTPGIRFGEVASASAQLSWVTAFLRREHLLAGRPWGQLAVIARDGATLARVRAACVAAGVPATSGVAGVPVRDEPAVRPLRLAVRAVCEASALTEDVAYELVVSPLSGADSLAVMRLRRWLLAAFPHRSSLESLRAAVADPSVLATAPGQVSRILQRLHGVLQAGRIAAQADDASAESVLWAVWDAGGLGPRWQQLALRGGREGSRADRDLDAVMALFDAAGRFCDRMPAAPPVAFLDLIESQQVAEDSLAERAPSADTVALLTPASAAGRQWPVVVILGLQEGAWPDLRLRGSLLGSAELAAVDRLSAARTDQERLRAMRTAILHDERRLLHVAVSRAGEQLAVCAIRSEEEQPSAFYDLLRQLANHPGDNADATTDDRTPAAGQAPLEPVPQLSTAAVTARLRRVVLAAGANAAEAQDAAHELARLRAAGVRGADPAHWYGLPALSDPGPLVPGGSVVVSPSAIETFLSCPLRWLLQRHGGAGVTGARQRKRSAAAP